MTKPIHEYKTIQLPSGISRPLVVNEPSRIVGSGRWESWIEGGASFNSDGSVNMLWDYGIHCRAPTDIENVVVGYVRRCGIYADADPGPNGEPPLNPPLRVRNTYLRLGGGIWSWGSLEADRLLIDVQAGEPEQDHGFYCAGHLCVSNSICRFSSFHVYGAPARGCVSNCVMVFPDGFYAVYNYSDVWFRDCTIIGRVDCGEHGRSILESDGNLILPTMEAAERVLLSPRRGWYTPKEPSTRGAYRWVDPAKWAAYARANWPPNGAMFNSANPYAMGPRPGYPIFPGDEAKVAA